MTTQYDLLLIVSVGAAAIAFLRMKPALFLFSANLAMTLRSLALTAHYGPPSGMRHVPVYVYTERNLMIAWNIFAIATIVLLIFLLIPFDRPTQRTLRAEDLPAVPVWALVMLGVYFVVVMVSMRSIMTTAYASEEQRRFAAPIGGIQVFASALLLYELYRRVSVGVLRARTGLIILLIVFLGTDYTKGQTGMATGFVITGAMMFYAVGRWRFKRFVPLTLIVAVLATAALVIRVGRKDVYERGTTALVEALDDVVSTEGGRTEKGEGIEARASGQEYAALVLECITLYESGNSREWKSLYYPLVYTFQPAYLVELFEWERPREAAWEIRDHFITNGGISIFGEAYWNGGYACVWFVVVLLVWFCHRCDSRYRLSFPWLIIACNFVPPLTQGVGYGISYEVRGLVNGLLMIVLWYAGSVVSTVRIGPRPA